MASMASITLFFILFLHSSLAILVASDVSNQIELETYIVHVQKPPASKVLSDLESLDSWYSSFLPATTANTNEEEPRMVYSYHNVFTGFAAKLSSEEVKALENVEGFVSARPQKVVSLHTTHSPDFLGLHQNFGFWKESNYGRGTIIGVLDTGIRPDHPSFADEGMPPPPAKWKGRCEFNFTGACNNKLIGARFFRSAGGGTPLDEEGHGTHTASTAAGNFVKGANVFGNANGTAVGIAPFAHVAMYKVCSSSCPESDILAAMDVAIDDGVDVLSISIGGLSSSFYDDNIALGAFSAMEKGIFVSCSAGNNGPFSSSLANEAPWILTVGASTIDRKTTATAVLGDNQEFDGQTLFQPKNFRHTQLPLIYPGLLNASDFGPSLVSPGILKPDIIGPGVNILAAWPVSVENNTNATSTFNIISGTSMSCPHLSGIAALLKSSHPDWSPAAIKSAIMTTADLLNIENRLIEDERYLPANIFATGAGHVNPSKANDPGLVNCTETIPEAQLNYPSFAIRLGSSSTPQTYTRTVTNVGDANESYKVQIIPPTGVSVAVGPSTLNFSEQNQRLTYQVTFSRTANSFSGTFQGFVIWSSAKHFVRSPVAATLL
ncbi:unnamed protein product [Coffea canephora]|uniref:Subtilisin-like protease n=1 Tax=Coffea canephora TaxID=49390 RepID=A0A068UMT5_COFCA|nr:unnamed protein product [Coffea canephora]